MATRIDNFNFEQQQPAIHRLNLMAKLKATAFSYLEVARFELEGLLKTYGKRTFYSSLLILSGTLGLLWASVSLAFVLSAYVGWTVSSLILAGIFFVVAGAGLLLDRHWADQSKQEATELGNALLSQKIDRGQLELEQAITVFVKDLIHQANPEVVIEKMVHKSPGAAVIGSAIAGALFGMASSSSSRK
ncbi:MAG: hypothetical protein ABIR96_01165 [Bdellovibrionota bacterium]